MNTMKKMLCVVMVVVMMVAAVPMTDIRELDWFSFEAEALTYGQCGDNATYEYSKTYDRLIISGTGPMWDYESARESPFWNLEIKSIYISENITHIGDFSFTTKLTLSSVRIENGVTSIGDHAFSNCQKLTTVTFPESLISIYDNAFSACEKLTNVVIPDNVISIGEDAFSSCASLTSITIPESIERIGNYAFSGCDNLKSIIVSENNSYYSSDEYGVLFNKNKTELIQYPIGNDALSYKIPNRVTDIADYAFSYSENLTSVIFPDTIINIGSKAFYYCDNLSSIVMGNSIKSIGEEAFYNTSYYNDSSNWEENVLYMGKYLICGIDLSECKIKEGTTIIAERAFNNCPNLISITIPETVTSVGAFAFSYCRSLTIITIPGSITNIGDESFYGCTSLSSITVSADNTVYSNDDRGVLFNKDKTELITYPAGNVATSYNIPDSVTSIGACAFSFCRSLTSITIPDSVTSIGSCAFYDCVSLTSVTIPGSVTSIGSSAFYHCWSFTSITIPGSVTSIGDLAFYNCGLTSITIGDSVTSIGAYAFSGCTSLESVTTPDSVESIGKCAFYKCTSLKSITIPDGVKSIGEEAFRYCESLTSITIGDSVISMDDYAFSNCESLSSIIIGDSVVSIGEGAFFYCENLTNITIGDSVTNIGDGAFQCCESLTRIAIPSSVTNIGIWAFMYCDSITDVYYAGSEEQWNKISVGSNNNPLINANIHYNSTMPDTPDIPSAGDITAELDNVDGIDYTFTYNDSYFSESSYKYNHDLAIMSNCLALSAMIEPESDDLPYNAEFLFHKIGFDMGSYEYYGYGTPPQYNSIACAIASKNIPGTDETVIAIGVRGGGYDAEWGGNFNIGTEEEHEGFRQAKEGVLGYLNEYIAEHKDKFNSNIKFWISGYSRAAATSNLVAAELDKGVNPKKYESIAALNYKPEGVYAYTFETPIPTRDVNTKNALYDNIFNIVNRIDYVPKVAPEVWGYSRYGRDVFLPSPETYGSNYDSLYTRMKDKYKEMTGKEYKNDFLFYDADFSAGWEGVSFVSKNENYSQSRFLDELITLVAKFVIKSVPNYVNNYQSSIQKLMVATLGGGFSRVEIPDNTMNEIMSMIVTAIISSIGINNNGWRSNLAGILSGIDGFELTYTDAYNLLGIVDEALLTGAVGYNYVYTFIENKEIIMPAHETAVNFAWVAAMDGEEVVVTDKNTCYRVIKFNCPIDINLYDEEDNLLATVCGDNVDTAEDCHLSIYIDADGQKCFCLPEDTQYRFEITGTDEGTMNCSFSEYDFTKAENTETVNYYNIPVEEDKQFFVEVDKKADDGNDTEESIADDIIFTDEAEEIIENDEVIEGEEITEFTVTVESDSENSAVIGGGTYTKGNFVKVDAFATEGETFLGWYIDDVLISEEASYRFMVENDCTVVAKWFIEEEEETTTEPSTSEEESTTQKEDTETTEPTTTKKEEPTTKAPSTTKPITIKRPETTTTAPATTTVPTTEKKPPIVKAQKPAKVKIKKPSSKKKKQMLVMWNAVKDANGYQISYSTSKKFTNKTTKTKLIKKAKTTKTTLKKLKSGKKYFIKIRAYKNANGKKLYGAYSKVMTVKVK